MAGAGDQFEMDELQPLLDLHIQCRNVNAAVVGWFEWNIILHLKAMPTLNDERIQREKRFSQTRSRD